MAEAWRIFTPLLHKLDAGAKTPVEYKYGSRGVATADEFIQKSGFKFSGTYKWNAAKKWWDRSHIERSQDSAVRSLDFGVLSVALIKGQ